MHVKSEFLRHCIRELASSKSNKRKAVHEHLDMNTSMNKHPRQPMNHRFSKVKNPMYYHAALEVLLSSRPFWTRRSKIHFHSSKDRREMEGEVHHDDIICI